MKFDIILTETCAPRDWYTLDEETLLGEIVVESCREQFSLTISFWPLDKYYEQWVDALNRVLDGEKSAIITEIFRNSIKSKDYMLGCWQMHLENDLVKIHNLYIPIRTRNFEIRFGDIYDKLEEFIPNDQVTEEEMVSEWVVSRADAIKLRNKLLGQLKHV